MKFVVSTGILSQRIQNIRGVIGSKSTIAILDCFKFETNGLAMTITAGDSDNRIVTTLELIECDADVCFCINAKTLIDLLKELPDQPVAFEVDTDMMRISVRYQNGEFNVMGTKADDYPDMVFQSQEAQTVTMDCAALYDGISRCMNSVGDDEIRPVMSGILMDVTAQTTTFVATDGHKLVRDIVKSESPTAFNAILPKKIPLLLRTFLPKDGGKAFVSTNGSVLQVATSTYTLTGKLIEGKYPNYNSVIPQTNPYSITIDRQSLVSAARRVALFSSQNSSLVKLQVANDTLTLSGQDYDFSTSAEERVLCQYNDTPMTIGFKGSLLVEMLNLLDSDEVCLQMSDPTRPGIIVPSKEDEKEYKVLVLLMPMMVKD